MGKILSLETKKKISEAQKGEKNWNFGGTWTKEQRETRAKNQLRGDKVWNYKGPLPKCKDCGISLSTRKGKLGICVRCRGRYMTKENHPLWKGDFPKCIKCQKVLSIKKPKTILCVRCFAKTRSGEKSKFWKGGITPINQKIRGSVEYNEWERSVKKKDKYLCQKCYKNKKEKLVAHHILNFSGHINLRFDINNGITFCKRCHGWFHRIYGIKNNTKEQLIEFLKPISNSQSLSEEGSSTQTE